MAEDLKIVIGADTSQLNAELQAAENELRKLQTTLKKLSDVKDIEKTQTSIRYLQETIRDLNVESGKAGKQLGANLSNGANQATNAMTNLSRVVQDAPFGFMGVANNINPLLESFQRLKAETGSTGGALKALASSFMGGAGLGLAVSVATSLLVVFGDKLFATSKKTDDAAESAKKYQDTLNSIYEGQAKEGTQVISLMAILNNEVETRKRKNQALEDLKKINPEIFAGLVMEGNLVKGLDLAYQNWLAHQKDVIAAKILQAQLDEQITKLIKEQGYTQSSLATGLVKTFEDINKKRIEGLRALGDQGAMAANQMETFQKNINKAKADKIALISANIKSLYDRLTQLSKGIDINIDTKKVKKASEDLDELEIKVKKMKFKTPEIAPMGITVPAFLDLKIDLPKIQTGLIDLGDELTSFFEMTANNIATIFAETIANGFTLGGFFDSVFQMLGDGMKMLGKAFVQLGIQALIVKQTLFKKPGLAIAAGILLQAIGSGIANAYKMSGFALGTTFAPGGLALVGERGPEIVNIPRGGQVIPAGRTSQIMGGMESVQVYGVLRGQDIYFSNKKYGQTYGRAT